MTIKSNKKLMQGNVTLLSMFLNKQEPKKPKKKTLRECVEEALTEYVKYLKTLSESV